MEKKHSTIQYFTLQHKKSEKHHTKNIKVSYTRTSRAKHNKISKHTWLKQKS
jgi:hypothetical protein